MKIGLIQNKVTSDKKKNLEKTILGIEKASKQGANVVCLQELFNTPYIGIREDKSFFDLAETIPGPTTDALSKTARINHVTLIGGSLFEKCNDKHFNTSVVFGTGGEILGQYRKTHIPHDPHYWEQYYFSPGDSGYKVFDTEFGKIGVLICYDQWFPEAARATTLKGAEMLFFPTAIGWTASMKAEEPYAARNWVDIQRSHAIANHVYVAAVNRVGQEDAINFWGRSFVADPFGQTMEKARSDREQIIVYDCDFKQIELAKQWRFLENRRPTTYTGLTKTRPS